MTDHVSAHSTRRRLCQLALALPVALTAVAAMAPAHAETWPSKPLRWVVAYPAGGGQDFLARQLAPQMGKQLGQTVVIDNRPGAAGIIGTDHAAKSQGDGYTWVTGDNGALVFNTELYKRLPYNPSDFTPVGFMAHFPLILVVNPASGFTSVQQIIDTAKQQPGRLNYASPGTGSPHHLAMELLKERTQTYIVHVPYRGTAMASQDVMSGQLPITVLDTAAGLPLIRSGKLKALAVMSKNRIPSLPDVPTLHEAGVKNFEAVAWQGLFVPKSTPSEIVSRLSQEMQKAIVVPEVKSRLEEFGLEVAPTDSATMGKFIEQEKKFWHPLIRERKLSID